MVGYSIKHAFIYGNYEQNLKKTHWYEMTMPTKQKLVPQIEEGITELKMVKKKEIENSQNQIGKQ